jgi:hypothetical protein
MRVKASLAIVELGERLEAIKELFQRINDETSTFVNHVMAM